MKFWNAAIWSNFSAQMPAMMPSAENMPVEKKSVGHQPDRVEDAQIDKPDGDGEHSQPNHQSPDHGGGHVSSKQLEIRQRRQQHKDDVAGDL